MNEIVIPDNINADWPECYHYEDWSQRLLSLPPDEKLAALATITVNGCNHMLTMAIFHRDLFKKLVFDDIFAEQVRAKALELARLAATD